jgi:hypothetical protein
MGTLSLATVVLAVLAGAAVLAGWVEREAVAVVAALD